MYTRAGEWLSGRGATAAKNARMMLLCCSPLSPARFLIQYWIGVEKWNYMRFEVCR